MLQTYMSPIQNILMGRFGSCARNFPATSIVSYKYGNRKWNEKTSFRTQALCAVSLTFAQLPPENTLCALSGKTIRLEHPAILDKFASLARK